MTEKEELIKDRLQRLIERIKNADWKDCDRPYMARRAKELINELQKKGVDDIDKFVQQLLYRVNDKQSYLDILMEGRFAIILARNGFTDIHIEYAPKGPDLKAAWNRDTVYFEVTRRPSQIDEWAEHTEVYEMGLDKVETVIAKIQGKTKQLLDGEINIVVIWSDTINLLTENITEAFDYILQEIAGNPYIYKDLSGVLFTEGGVDITTLKQFYLFKNAKASKPIGIRLSKKLESLHDYDIKQLRQEINELTIALRQLRETDNKKIN